MKLGEGVKHLSAVKAFKTLERRFRDKHGDKYDYSRVVYQGSSSKVTIVCYKHGEFAQAPSNHLTGQGCVRCSLEKSSAMKTKSTNTFINESIAVHGDTYDYCEVDYKKQRVKVIIRCYNHGRFSQTPKEHISGKGCVKCGNERTGKISKKTHIAFVNDAKITHGNRYEYSDSKYINQKVKISILCKIHGAFTQSPKDHISGNGCPKCGIVKSTDKRTKTKSKFINDAVSRHGSKYSYSNVDYVNSITKVDIICNLHGVFSQYPSDHLSGKGCRSCANGGFDPNKSATLYYLKIYNGEAYKIGVTNKSVKERFSNKDLENIQVIEKWQFPLGKDAYAKEQEILKMYKKHKYEGSLLESGNTELFKHDVLGLDINI
jgi:hypothetical protein